MCVSFPYVDAAELAWLGKDMRMKFEDEDPSEVTKVQQGGIDRSQGAARAISVSVIIMGKWINIHHITAAVFHRSQS
jgi:hypothetical protein